MLFILLTQSALSLAAKALGWCQWAGSRWPTLWAMVLCLSGAQGLHAQSAHTPPGPAAVASGAAASDTAASTVVLNNRKIITFRADLLGDTPAERAALAQLALTQALQTKGPGKVARAMLDEAARIELDGQTLFFVLPGDLGGPRPASLLDAASQDVVRRLQTAVDETRERTDPTRWAVGIAYALAATLFAWLGLKLLWRGKRRLTQRMQDMLQQTSEARLTGSWLVDYTRYARASLARMVAALSWLAALVLLELWATFVLHQFAYTRPWGERSTAWLLDLLGRFATSAAVAIPGLLTAMLIFFIARTCVRVGHHLLQRVETGEISLTWLTPDTAAPTRRLLAAAIWLFALAMAYPYLPGSDSEAFKGVSVLAGLMLSLGSSSVIGQALSGLSLMYSRSLREGEYVKVGDVEGTVAGMGMFTTRIHTGLGEEVSLPNSVVFAQPIRNYSRMVKDGRFMIHTSVTIGYATPWRQVHAMLMEGARRSPDVAQSPAPYVVQTALSDFYVEYRLCAQSSRHAPAQRAAVVSQLLSNVQDVFNENGVQIMSPHYMADPPEPQVVPPGPWASPPGAQPVQPPDLERPNDTAAR